MLDCDGLGHCRAYKLGLPAWGANDTCRSWPGQVHFVYYLTLRIPHACWYGLTNQNSNLTAAAVTAVAAMAAVAAAVATSLAVVAVTAAVAVDISSPGSGSTVCLSACLCLSHGMQGHLSFLFPHFFSILCLYLSASLLLMLSLPALPLLCSLLFDEKELARNP